MQASEDGSLPFLISKVRTQPQVYTAYAKTAAVRDKALSAELEAAVLPLKVCSLDGDNVQILIRQLATTIYPTDCSAGKILPPSRKSLIPRNAVVPWRVTLICSE